MGNMQQMGYAEAVADGLASLEHALSASFGSNFYPPLDQGLVAPTAEAVRLAAPVLYEPEALHDLSVSLPDGLRMYPRAAEPNEDGVWTVRVVDLIEATRSWPFVEALAEEAPDGD